jgi:Zn-dependent protease
MMHGTFVLLLAFYAVSGFMAGGAAQAVLNLALGLIVFSVVVMHELGHIAAYKRYGIQAKDIILSPLGGIARGIGMTKNPRQEFIIAAAGPAVNVVLAGVAFLAIQATPWAAMGAAGGFALALTTWFLNVNVFLLLFTHLPALPMDGGRMLRAALTSRMGFLRATNTAARVARWSTLAMAVYGIATGNFTLLLIAGMIFVMSWVEVAQAHVGEASRNPLFQAFQGNRGPARGRGGATIVDQYGNPVGGPVGGGWSSAEQVQPTPDGRGWTVKSVRFLGD